MDDGPSSLKKWKNKFFLIDRRAIPDHLIWRHSHSYVSDDLPVDGYDRNDVERLRVHLIRLCEMKEEVLVRSGLSSIWSNKDCDLVFRRNDDNSEPHHHSAILLECVLSYTTVSAVEDALIPLPTSDEVATAQPDPCLARKQSSKKRRLKKRAAKAGSSAPKLGQAEGLNEADITDFCAELEDSMERDGETYIRAALVSTPCLSKRLGPPPSMVVAVFLDHPLLGLQPMLLSMGVALLLEVWCDIPFSFFTNFFVCSILGSVAGGFAGKSIAEDMRRQMDPLDALARSALSHDAEYDEIPEDDFGTATCGEVIELTLKALDRTITPAELRRTEYLLLLELSNRVNVLSALLVSHGYELNSRYTDLVAFRVPLQEKLNQKKGDVKVLCLEVTSLDNKLKKVQMVCDALGLENRELRSQRDVASEEELVRTDAKLSEQALIVRDLHNELALERSKSQGYKDVVNELRMEVTQFMLPLLMLRSLADFNKALVAFPTTQFPFLG
ncbi:hypothetical protein Tco_1390340, partial [Tanacetum coccineum]